MTKAERREATGLAVHVPPGFSPWESYPNEELARVACARATVWDKYRRKWSPHFVKEHWATDDSGFFEAHVMAHWCIRSDRMAGWSDWHPFILLGISAACWLAVILYLASFTWSFIRTVLLVVGLGLLVATLFIHLGTRVPVRREPTPKPLPPPPGWAMKRLEKELKEMG